MTYPIKQAHYSDTRCLVLLLAFLYTTDRQESSGNSLANFGALEDLCDRYDVETPYHCQRLAVPPGSRRESRPLGEETPWHQRDSIGLVFRSPIFAPIKANQLASPIGITIVGHSHLVPFERMTGAGCS